MERRRAVSEDPLVIQSDKTPLRLVRSCALLTTVVIVGFPFFAWYGIQNHGTWGLVAASISGIVCWLGALIALILAGVSQGTSTAIRDTMLGSLVRTVMPFGVGLVTQWSSPPLASANIFGMIVVYYLLTLTAETVLAVRFLSVQSNESKTA